jgi:hypothetical protein
MLQQVRYGWSNQSKNNASIFECLAPGQQPVLSPPLAMIWIELYQSDCLIAVGHFQHPQPSDKGLARSRPETAGNQNPVRMGIKICEVLGFKLASDLRHDLGVFEDCNPARHDPSGSVNLI